MRRKYSWLFIFTSELNPIFKYHFLSIIWLQINKRLISVNINSLIYSSELSLEVLPWKSIHSLSLTKQILADHLLFVRHYMSTKITETSKLWFPSSSRIRNIYLPSLKIALVLNVKSLEEGSSLSGPKLRIKSISKMTLQIGTSHHGPP